MTKQELFDKFVELMGRFADIRAVAALRDGFIMTTPFTICGSVFLLLANLPIPGYADFMAGIFGKDWTIPLNAVAGGTFSVLAVIAVLAITYKYVEAEGCDAIMASILALTTFIIVLPPFAATKDGVIVNDVIPKAWAGSNGVITAILVSFFVSAVFCYCEKNHIGIKMPDAVPGGVAKAFEALVPGMVLFTTAAIVYGVCHFALGTTFPELIFKIIQTPLQGLSDSVVGGTVIVSLQSILFWAGIHGPNVVGGVVNPLLIANSLDNQALIDAGQQLAGNPAAKIFTCQINDVFVKSGGCGLTMGFLIASWLSAKSDQMKSITKLATVPGLFNINEPRTCSSRSSSCRCLPSSSRTLPSPSASCRRSAPCRCRGRRRRSSQASCSTAGRALSSRSSTLRWPRPSTSRSSAHRTKRCSKKSRKQPELHQWLPLWGSCRAIARLRG